MAEKHLITVDELRAAGALYVPPAWRKTLGEEEPDLFSGLLDDHDPPLEDQGAEPSDADTDESEDQPEFD